MANHALPSVSDTYANVLAYIDGRLDDLALGLDPATSTPSNLPTSSIRWTSAANKWQKWNGTAWGDLATTYAIAISGNAATATTLATARTINGTSFNGGANITTSNWGTARNITIGSTTRSVNGSANYTWTLGDLGFSTFSQTLVAASDGAGYRATIGVTPRGNLNTVFSYFAGASYNPVGSSYTFIPLPAPTIQLGAASFTAPRAGIARIRVSSFQYTRQSGDADISAELSITQAGVRNDISAYNRVQLQPIVAEWIVQCSADDAFLLWGRAVGSGTVAIYLNCITLEMID